ncbi:MAG: F0F1 ATP synthase subunit B [Clostridiales Family XIII bacterium]|jgi:F-type H+-transporting ATPase subunit b|nr:F0F1 ATP synthase subunit B [Clostridiales Family XIII bacterium]
MHSAPLISFNWTLVMVLITFLVLYFILKKFFFEKVRAFMLAREQKVTDAFDNADAVSRVAEERLETYNLKLADIESERREVLREAKLQADENAREIIRNAEAQASKILTQAEKDILREREHALQDMRDQIAMLSIYAAEKILEQKLDAGQQQTIINKALENAGNSNWKI